MRARERTVCMYCTGTVGSRATPRAGKVLYENRPRMTMRRESTRIRGGRGRGSGSGRPSRNASRREGSLIAARGACAGGGRAVVVDHAIEPCETQEAGSHPLATCALPARTGWTRLVTGARGQGRRVGPPHQPGRGWGVGRRRRLASTMPHQPPCFGGVSAPAKASRFIDAAWPATTDSRRGRAAHVPGFARQIATMRRRMARRSSLYVHMYETREYRP